ncbi:MAG: YncE family protein [Gemmatimonadetes bacterium]|nr:YncE family protein [Gemmatimonadota bacterium]
MSRSASVRSVALVTVTIALVLGGAAVARAQDAGGYHLARKIPVGGDGGWDYAVVDGDRLYTSHGSRLVVIDLTGDSVMGEVSNTNGIHGVAIAPELNRGFTSNGRDTSVTIFNLATLATIGTVHVTGANPDAIHYDVATRRIFTFNGRGENATVIDAVTGSVLATIPLPGKPEFAQSDGNGRLYVNIETDTGQIVVIDTKAMREVSRYWLPGCEGPSGLALDRENSRLFSACGNSVMAVSDPGEKRVVTLIPIGPGVDAAAYDAATRLVFASNGGNGTLTVARQDGADRYTVLGNVATQRGSRTMALDARTHRVYLASAEYGPAPAPTQPGARPGRPPMVAGSFAILVMEPAAR